MVATPVLGGLHHVYRCVACPANGGLTPPGTAAPMLVRPRGRMPFPQSGPPRSGPSGDAHAKGAGLGSVAQIPVHEVRPNRILVVESEPLGFETLDLLSGPGI